MTRKSQRHSKRRERDGDPKPVPGALSRKEPEFLMERYGRIRDMDRSFDIEYWQRQGHAAIFRAAWELVELYWRTQSKDPNELRLQRSVESFERL
jgi:hypothetical protein